MANDKLIYKDNNVKSKGYILNKGSYSKKLRINSKKIKLMEDKLMYYNGLNKNFFNTSWLCVIRSIYW